MAMADHSPATERVDRCELCQNRSFDLEFKAGDWSLNRCCSCRLVFTSPRYTADYLRKKYQESYYEIAGRYLETQLTAPLPDEISLALALRKKGSRNSNPRCRSLDVGCGAGRIVSAFQKAGWDAWGCDRSLKAVEHGTQSGLQICAADISEISLGSFDLISAFHVLEHIVHPREFLAACHSRLSPGGFLLLEVPNFGSRRACTMKESWPHLYPDIHLYQFEIGTLKRLLEESGFRVVRIDRVGGRGPLEEPAQARACTGDSGDAGWHERVFGLRKLIYWIPGVRKVARRIFWQTLGFGEFIRVLARLDR